jgi:hypothetical protein
MVVHSKELSAAPTSTSALRVNALRGATRSDGSTPQAPTPHPKVVECQLCTSLEVWNGHPKRQTTTSSDKNEHLKEQPCTHSTSTPPCITPPSSYTSMHHSTLQLHPHASLRPKLWVLSHLARLKIRCLTLITCLNEFLNQDSSLLFSLNNNRWQMCIFINDRFECFNPLVDIFLGTGMITGSPIKRGKSRF